MIHITNYIDEFCITHAKLQTIIEILEINKLVDLIDIIKKLVIPIRIINIEERTEISEHLFKGWHKNGRIGYEYNYKNGQYHGTNKGWHENGQIRYEINYFTGKNHGTDIEWYSDGQILRERNWNNGHICRESIWHSDGINKSIKYVVNGQLKNGNILNNSIL